MERLKAIDTIASLFNSTFDKEKFTSFISNLLNSASFANQTLTQNNQINDQFKGHIESLERLTTFNDEKDNEIDVLIVTLLKDTSLDRARAMQRNFVARHLSNNNKDAALVAFVFPGSPDWRFSLISMESRFEGTKVIDEYTPAKRWSFLVGSNEGSHTAQRQLLEILANDSEDPTMEELEQAFSIETVTNEFFAKYTDLFHRMKEALDELLETDEKLKSDFEDKEVNTSDFAKKTMGQIAFLYFLQKKGWFGVAPGKEWGSGVKNFLREVFERREKYGSNFFDDVLEPLFYEALAQDRGNESIYPKLNSCRMPFLNGGLFEPMNGYSWETTHIRLPDELFSNLNETKEGDIGDGILDIFDRYNFTVNESEPLEQEVAVDPEMLGKVFENLLEIKDRKSKGAFYTPREIVHYMCQESLINYLETETNALISKSDIELFIRQGSQIIQNDKSSIEQGGDKDGLLLPQSISNQAEELDDLLANIKVCDPAVGSGAFPLGMLNEIVTARTILGIHLRNNPSAYNLKLHAISNSIYGVDLDPGAVEIAKLRFWLSLVVEEDNPTPLPNLEHKVIQGDSLISKYEGIELFDDDYLNSAESINDEKNEIQDKLDAKQKEYFSLHSAGEFTITRKAEIEEEIKRLQRRLKFLSNKNNITTETGSLFDMPQAKKIAQQKAKLLQSKIAQYVTIDSKTNKENLKKEIDHLKWDLIEATLEERDEVDKLDEIKKLRKDRVKPFFIWKLEFGNVFKNNGGFDVVIGNPPYMRLSKKDSGYSYFKSSYMTATKGKLNTYKLFYELAISLQKNNGILSFITPNTYLTSGDSLPLRKLLLDNESIIEIIEYSEKDKVFENVAQAVTTLVSIKNNNPQNMLRINTKKHGYIRALQSQLLNNKGLVFIYKNNVIKSINKNTHRISDYFDIYQGEINLTVKKKYLSINKKNERYMPMWRGIQVGKYTPVKTSSIDYCDILGDDRRHFHCERIIIQQVSNQSLSFRTKAFISEKGYLCGNSTNYLVPKNDNISLPAYLCIINSLVFNYYFNYYSFTNHITVGELIEVPIPKLKQKQQIILEKIYEKIILLKGDSFKNSLTAFENEIDKLVFDLYELTPEDREIILNS